MITPLEHSAKLAAAIGASDLYLKREDLHPYGSHKGRSIPVMIDHYAGKGDKEFAITGSGNAALAAALHVQKLNKENPAKPLDLDIYVGAHINEKKASKLKGLLDDHIKMFIKERPLQTLTWAAEEGKRSLRQSTDDEALAGYDSLAEELIADKELSKKGLGAVFIGTSSGTTAQALALYFKKKKLPVQIHIVQTPSIHPISDLIESYDGPDEESIADAIVDLTGHRKNVLAPLIKESRGNAWVATNDDIGHAQDLVHEHTGLDISTNSALSVAGAMLAAERGWEIKGAIVCMICGD